MATSAIIQRSDSVVSAAMCSLNTPVGPLHVTTSHFGVVEIAFGDQPHLRANEVAADQLTSVDRSDEPFDPEVVVEQIDQYMSGDRREFELPLDLALATPFAHDVLVAASFIPYGETVSYAELAASIHRPSAARAVGNALGSNPIPIVIPCHRILRSGGIVGGYARSLTHGSAIKRALLKLEREH